jgi:hypothetical protein
MLLMKTALRFCWLVASMMPDMELKKKPEKELKKKFEKEPI